MDECWPWTGWGAKDESYGVIVFHKNSVAVKHERATRLVWEIVYGEEPGELHVCHTCDYPPCCNPIHLFLGTPLDNQHDKMRKGRYQNGNSVKTHCIRGHALEGGNLIVNKDGRRNCRECRRIYYREVVYPRWCEQVGRKRRNVQL